MRDPDTSRHSEAPSEILYSVVVTTHNEAGTIRETIESIARQEGIGPRALEIVLVDDRSTDATIEEARKAGIPQLRILQSRPASDDPLTTRQTALDLGFRHAKGKVILTVDADSRVGPDWVRRMAAPILDGRAGAVAGALQFRPRESWIWLWQSLDACFYLTICTLLARLRLRTGIFFGNFAFRARLYREIGGFSSIGFALTEDLAFAHSLQGQNQSILFDPRSVVSVAPCASLGELIARTKRVSTGPLSALAVTLAIWLGALPVLALGALVVGGPITANLLIARYAAGVLLVATGLCRCGKWRLLPSAPLYEPLAVLLGLGVLLDAIFRPQVSWGGRQYQR